MDLLKIQHSSDEFYLYNYSYYNFPGGHTITDATEWEHAINKYIHLILTLRDSRFNFCIFLVLLHPTNPVSF